MVLVNQIAGFQIKYLFLEQSNEIVYFLHVHTRNQELIEILGWCGQKWLWPSWSQGEWMNEWIN